MAVTAAMVKELREMTGAGMMDCKKALEAVEGDMDKAVDFLREKGLAGAEKKAGRIAAEGIVKTAVSEDEKTAVVVEVNGFHIFVGERNIDIFGQSSRKSHGAMRRQVEGRLTWEFVPLGID